MLVTQKKYLRFLEEAKNALNKVSQSTDSVDEADDIIRNAELLVPVIGSFSSGKSTIINTLMDCKTLPVAVTPETDLAAELRFDEYERIEAIRPDGSIKVFEINGFDEIKSLAREFNYIRVYLNNVFLKSIQPLVLVDMPGFDSTLEAHNKAIFRYIEKGAHYIVLISSEEGTIPRSVLQNLEHIDIADQKVSIFVSKADRRAPEELKDVVEQIGDVAQDQLDYDGKVTPISIQDPLAMRDAIVNIDPEILFEHLAGDYLKSLSLDIQQPLSIREAGLQSSSEKDQELQALLVEKIEDLEVEKAEVERSLQSNHSRKLINKCKLEVQMTLVPLFDSFADQIVIGNSEVVKSQLSNSVRNAVVRVLDKELRKISDEAVSISSERINNISGSLSGLGLDPNWVEGVTDSIRDGLNGFNQQISRLSDGLKSRSEEKDRSDNWNSAYRVIASVAAITTSIASPIVELVLVFLPDIIKLFTGGDGKKKIIETLNNETLPKIYSQLDSELPSIIDEQITEISESVHKAFSLKLEEARKALEISADQRSDSIEENRAEIERIKQARNEISKAANEYLFTNFSLKGSNYAA